MTTSVRHRASNGRQLQTTSLAALAAILASLLGFSCERAPAKPEVRAHSERLGALHKHYRARSLAVSLDLSRVAWIDHRADGCRVVVGRERGPKLAGCGNPRFSPDGTTVAYFAAEKVEKPPRIQLMVNGEKSPVEVGDEGVIAFAKTGGAWAAVAPARPEKAVEETAGEAADAGEAPKRSLVVFGPGGVLGEHHDTTTPSVSPDGKHVAYLAATAEGRQSLIVDGKVAKEFPAPSVEFLPALKEARHGPNLEPEATARYLADGSLLVVALAENGWTVLHDDQVLASYAGIRLPPDSGFQVTGSPLLERAALLGGSLVTAEAAPVACWWERLEGGTERWRVVCNGKPVDEQICDQPATGIPITVTPDGRATMYACQITGPVGADGQPDPKNLWVIAGDRKRGPHRFVWGLTLTPDARHYAFAAADSVDDTWFYDVDGKRYDGPWQHAFPAAFSPDGSSVVWGASPDRDGRRVELVRDGDVVARGDMVMAPPVFRGNEVEWALKRGKSVRRVIVD
jgi:hypothetical protein